MRGIALGVLIGVLSVSGMSAWQGSEAATYVTKTELDAVFETIGESIDKQVKVVDIGDDTNVAVGILNRAEMNSDDGHVRMIVHHEIAEVYYIVAGSGVLASGGTMAATREFPIDSAVVTELVGPSASGGVAEPVSARPVGAGDVVVIPVGVPHGFRQIDETITYLSIRVDPDQVLPAGYINTAIQAARQ